jgi:TorA maturation chaperone TorD
MRVMAFLGLKPGASMLPPDHLAVACEVYAQALARDERVLVAELRARYFLPWCDVAAARLEGRLGEVVARFREVI